MADQPVQSSFPNDDALCERCGYPIRGLSIDAVCPECGFAVEASSPDKRFVLMDAKMRAFTGFWRTCATVLWSPVKSYRLLRIESGLDSPRSFLTRSCFFASVLWAFGISFALGNANWPLKVWCFSLGLQFVIAMLVLHGMSYIEMVGVTTFSRRRGWRVPFRLAHRVCCYASVGWLPGVLIGACGVALIESYLAGRFWFESQMGLVRVRWIFYGGLFVMALLWFETLVWIGVRQVRYANARPDTP